MKGDRSSPTKQTSGIVEAIPPSWTMSFLTARHKEAGRGPSSDNEVSYRIKARTAVLSTEKVTHVFLGVIHESTYKGLLPL